MLTFLIFPASGAAIIGNISGTGHDGTVDTVTNSGKWGAIAFTMGASDYAISSLDILAQVTCTGGGSNCLSSSVAVGTAAIYTNNGSNLPGTLVGSFTLPSWSADVALSVMNFTASSAFTLSSGQTYWLVVYATTATGKRELDWAHWNAGTLGAVPVGAGATYAAPGMSSGNHSLQNGGPITSWGQGPQYWIFGLNGTEVAALPVPAPEPSTFALLGAGLLGLAAVGKRLR